ncbi:MAG: PIN domain-containing protein [Rhodoferax sp.]|nr:PIN domain-containing protein [Rhodoferax sp.]
MRANVFVDTNIWLYALVRNPADTRHQRAADFIFQLKRPMINSQVIRETCHNLIKKSSRSEVELQRFLVGWSSTCEIIHSHVGQHVLASQLREKGAFSYWDSLIIAAALDAGCSILYSEDMQHGQQINNQLTIVNPLDA